LLLTKLINRTYWKNNDFKKWLARWSL